MLMGRSFRYSFPLRVMLMTGSSSLVSLTCLTSGTLISRPNSITCAVSMKMISSTSTTSTSGTILISESAPLPAPKRRRPRPLLVPLVPLTEKAMLIRLALEHALDRVLEFEREVFHARAHLFNDVPEIIIENRSGNSRKQTQGGSEQRIGNARRHGPHAGGAGEAQGLESFDDAEYGPEQAHERRDRSRGSQPAHAAFQLGDLFADAQLKGALHCHWVGNAAALGYLAIDFAIAEIEHRDQRGGGELLAGGGDGIQPVRLAKSAKKILVGRSRAPEHEPFREDDRPGEQRKKQQNAHHRNRDRLRASYHLPKIDLRYDADPVF